MGVGGGEESREACISNSKKLTCPFFPTLLYLVRKIIIYTPHIHTYQLTLLSHFSVGSEFRKRGAIYWASIRILETIQFPILITAFFFPAEAMNWWAIGQIHTVSCFAWPTECLLKITAPTFKKWEIACTHQDFWPFLNSKIGKSSHIGPASPRGNIHLWLCSLFQGAYTL